METIFISSVQKELAELRSSKQKYRLTDKGQKLLAGLGQRIEEETRGIR